MIIVFEGISNAGKSTMCNLLEKYLEKKGYTVYNLNDKLDADLFSVKVKSITSPSTNILSPNEELLLYSFRLNRKVLFINEILKHNPNSIILVDRFALTLRVFLTEIRKLPPSLIDEMFQLIISDLKIDYTFLLRVDIKDVFSRKNSDMSRKNSDIKSDYLYYNKGFERHQETYKAISINTSEGNQADVLINITDQLKILNK